VIGSRQFVGDAEFELQNFESFVEAAALGSLFKERLVVMAHRVKFQVSQSELPSVD